MTCEDYSSTAAIEIYYFPTLVIFGAIGNCLTIRVFLSKEWRKAPSSVYLTALAITNTLYLIYLCLNWMELMGYMRIDRPGLCHFALYLSMLLANLSVWFVVAFTVERFAAVCHPLRSKSICTVAR